MSETKPSTETEEELDAVAKANGFHLEDAALKSRFLEFLHSFGEEDVCIAKDIPDGVVTLYALIKLTKQKIAACKMQDAVRSFLSRYGVVNNCPCTLFAGGVMCITADVRKAKSKSERLQAVRERRKGRDSNAKK